MVKFICHLLMFDQVTERIGQEGSVYSTVPFRYCPDALYAIDLALSVLIGFGQFIRWMNKKHLASVYFTCLRTGVVIVLVHRACSV